MSRARLAVVATCIALVSAGCGASGGEQRDDALNVSRAGWKTDFSRHSVPLSEFRGGGPGRDGIPPIDKPKFVAQERADAWMADNEPVLVVESGTTSAAFDRRLEGRALDFERRGDDVVDRQTQSTWDITGRATNGPLTGKRLKAVRHDQQFWFALAAFLPDARIVE